MTGCPPDETTLQRFIAAVAETPPRPHHASLLAAAERILPGCGLRHVLTRGGWYRPGAVIRPDGTRLSEDVEQWAEEELEDCDGDMDALVERHAGDGLLTTRLSGRTHYFVVPYGSGPAEFLQMEIEELQEVLDRKLVNPDAPPADLPELTDPITPASVPALPLGPSHYRFRRLTDMRKVLASQPVPAGGISPLARFFSEWAQSSAAAAFPDHWVVALREHQDRYRNSVLTASPVSRHARKLRPYHWDLEASGTALSAQLLAFDRAAGYPAAWYFHLVAGGLVPRALAQSLKRDLDAGFRYLAGKEEALLQNWLVAPYAV